MRSPVAAYAVTEGENLLLTGLYVSPDGQTARKGALRGKKEEAAALGARLAEQLRKEAARG